MFSRRINLHLPLLLGRGTTQRIPTDVNALPVCGRGMVYSSKPWEFWYDWISCCGSTLYEIYSKFKPFAAQKNESSSNYMNFQGCEMLVSGRVVVNFLWATCQDVSRCQPRKKKRPYFPLNPGCLIGIQK